MEKERYHPRGKGEKAVRIQRTLEIVETFLEFLLETNEISPIRPKEVLFDSDENKA